MNVNTLEYKGYHGTVESDIEREVLRGKILFIADLVTFESTNLSMLKEEFRSAVDDYHETCIELGREPCQPASGNLNVRPGPERHRAAQILAVADGVTLNEVFNRALDCYLSAAREVRERVVVRNLVSIRDAGPEQTFVLPLDGDYTERSKPHVFNS